MLFPWQMFLNANNRPRCATGENGDACQSTEAPPLLHQALLTLVCLAQGHVWVLMESEAYGLFDAPP